MLPTRSCHDLHSMEGSLYESWFILVGIESEMQRKMWLKNEGSRIDDKCWQWCMCEDEVGEANLPSVY